MSVITGASEVQAEPNRKPVQRSDACGWRQTPGTGLQALLPQPLGRLAGFQRYRLGRLGTALAGSDPAKRAHAALSADAQTRVPVGRLLPVDKPRDLYV